MDKQQYAFEANRQLNNVKYYKQISESIQPQVQLQIREIITNLYHKKFISAKQRDYLYGPNDPRPCQFYLLPKIHKDPHTWTIPSEIPPGRPIVSDCGSATYNVSQYIDSFLGPLSVRHPSYLKDTYHFLEVIRSLVVPVEAFLFTIDVDSLYTNIDIQEGIQAIKNIMKKYPDRDRPDGELLRLLEINLTRNDFEFNGDFFLQIKDTAMGKKFAPAYANIFMAEWESTALASCQKKPLYYYRYLDDIWRVWTHSEEDFKLFLTSLNNHNSSIKLKSTLNHNSVNFLDTTTYKGQSFAATYRLDIKVFFKETDTHALLYKSSFHPRHTYAGLVKSQLLRFHRICTRRGDFIQATKTLFSALRHRGYNRGFLRKSYKTFLDTKPQQDINIIPFVTTYSTSAVKVVGVVKNNFQNIIAGTQTLEHHRVIAAFRKNKNLQDYLVKAKIKPLNTPKPKSDVQFFKHRDWVRNKYNKNEFYFHRRETPHSKNCVYLITCTKCEAQYVGETGNTILQRFAQHKYNIFGKKQTGPTFSDTWLAVSVGYSVREQSLVVSCTAEESGEDLDRESEHDPTHRSQ
ncbi:hypothetical protein LDENG_00236130 [Lucifuga dentata]|nr:hypothetical protein LDENG_00236130 [Lucifuga dentata]